MLRLLNYTPNLALLGFGLLVACFFSLVFSNIGTLVLYVEVFGLMSLVVWISFGRREDSGIIYKLYSISIFGSALAFFVTNLFFELNYGFAGAANDELKFYNWISSAVLEHSIYSDFEFLRKRYAGYQYPVFYLSQIPLLFGEFDIYMIKYVSHFALVPIPLFCYFIIRSRFGEKFAFRIAALSVFAMPTVSYYGSVGVRDIFFTAALCGFFCLLVCKVKAITKLFLYVLLIGFVYSIRPESALFMVGALMAYYLIVGVAARTFFKVGLSISVILLGGVVLIAYSVFFDNLLILFWEIYQNYDQMALNITRSEAFIRSLPVPLDLAILGAYGLGGTFPPELAFRSPFVFNSVIEIQDSGEIVWLSKNLPVDFGRILKVVGQVIWYFLLPYMLLGVFARAVRSALGIRLTALLLVGFIYILTISQFSFELGRLHAPYPIMIAIGLSVATIVPSRARTRVSLLTVFCLMILYLVYYSIT